MTSPTQRSLALCRKEGWLAAIAEKWVPFPKPGHRVDLFGFIDLVVLDDQASILAVQATATASMSSRQKKIEATPAAYEWLRRGQRIEVWGWAKRTYRLKNGKRSQGKRWTLRAMSATLEGDRLAWTSATDDSETTSSKPCARSSDRYSVTGLAQGPESTESKL